MVLYRTLFAAVLILSLALAPVGAALAARQMSPDHTKADCHGKAAHDSKTAKDCPCCDTKGTCPSELCGHQCCKLQATLAVAPTILWRALVLALPADPEKPPDWLLRPQLPPPRS
jgi:hypothetical protein